MSYQLWRRLTVALAIVGVSGSANLANAEQSDAADHLSPATQATALDLAQGMTESAETVMLSPTAEERQVANRGVTENTDAVSEELAFVPSQILDNSSVLEALAPSQPEVFGTLVSATYQAYRQPAATEKPEPAAKSDGVLHEEQGIASWYGPGFEGNQTANGEIFNSQDLTAAHLELPFGTRVRVTNLNNGRSLVVRINDRGPYIGNRIIDLSAGAARELGMIYSGTAPVVVEVLAN
ncbi:septal ring lytic transglycosylase RlpA family protein [Phormidium yuhuli]|uniref:septal ring lytic transglycosylase RlpA family protein n=1 Tax=Phormidium yuhuli TaxID=2974039 RepID=UPI0035A96FDC